MPPWEKYAKRYQNSSPAQKILKKLQVSDF
ncbi:hypothetical protein QF045_005321 [Pseudomonas sp. W4I3]|nr:hypothetical protein [Pseudomonas sp. W4I3]